MGRGPFECHCYNQVLEEVTGAGSCGPEAAGKAAGGGEARPCNVSCFLVPVGKGADGDDRGGNSVGVPGTLGSLAGTQGGF